MSAHGLPAIEFEAVSRSFCARGGSVTGLRPLTLRVDAGEVVALAGANGSGKTTALRILAALVTPSSGKALLCGRDVTWDPPGAGVIGLSLGSRRSFYWRLTARQNLAFFGRLAGMGGTSLRVRIAEAAEELGVGHALDIPARRLSRGTLARLSVARALLHEPPVVLLDEPFAAVDARGRDDIKSALRRAAARGAASLVTVQERAEALGCDRVRDLSNR